MAGRKVVNNRPKTLKIKTNEQFAKAIEDITENNMSISAAARKHGIPRLTLSDRVNGRRTAKHGRLTELNKDEEQSLVTYIKYMAAIAHPLSVTAIKAFAWEISKRNNNKSRFHPTKGPSHRWWSSFRGRHKKEITIRKPDSIDRGRSQICSETVINQHFDLLEKELKDKDLINKPHLIFDADKTGINLDARNGKVVVARKTKHPYAESKGMREHITMNVCCSAAGQKLPPFIIFERSFPSSDTHGPENAVYAKSPSGYMKYLIVKGYIESTM